MHNVTVSLAGDVLGSCAQAHAVQQVWHGWEHSTGCTGAVHVACTCCRTADASQMLIFSMHNSQLSRGLMGTGQMDEVLKSKSLWAKSKSH